MRNDNSGKTTLLCLIHLPCPSNRGSLVVKAMDSWPACHEFESSTAEDHPCRGAMDVKSVDSSNVLPLNSLNSTVARNKIALAGYLQKVLDKPKFRRFRDTKRGAWQTSKKFEDAELQALLDEDDGKTQEHLAEQLNADQSTISRRLKAMSKIIKVGRWGANGPSTGKPKNRVRNVVCPLQTQEGPIYYELLKPGETVNTDCYKQQLLNLNDAILEKHEHYKKQQHKVIFLVNNAPSNRDKPTKDIVKALGWELLAHAAYSPDLTPSDYHLFASLGHALAEQRFISYENVKYWLDDWLASKDRTFFLAWYSQIV
ncbi:mariner Mos1 transposase [Trichonephila clavipes]|uniref:Mariner Mos1 transposase n=1 Tax=Trichonephila clavipes TaxID=2585209 RepID=A0A8X6RTF6_TRICX|nr:mariner Mos1 transposase [Trichonephila clavipes]